MGMEMKEKLEKEIVRCKELLKMYKEIPEGIFGTTMLRIEILNAENAIEKNNENSMKFRLKNLKGMN